VWLLIVRMVTQPVSNVLARMQSVQAGDLSVRAEQASADQVGELARGFNSMVTSLETTTAELHDSHAKQMQQASKLASIGELASGIALEIRYPLTGIGAAVEVLAETHTGDSQYREIAGEIRRQIQRLNTTVCDLLDFARQREPEIVPCQLCDVVKPMITLVRPDAQKQHVALVEECPAELPPICADVPQVQQAILNILLNALQAMPDGGTLTISAAVVKKTLRPGHDQSVSVAIRDTGAGIPPFFTTKHRGTGLGLAITRSIMEKHHGTINVESAVGRGTTFTLEFAVCTPEVCNAQKQSFGR
jgi:signal transduction histidine kinase